MHLDALIIREVTQIVFHSSLLACAFQYQYHRVQSDHVHAYSKFRKINESQSKLAIILYHRANYLCSLINNTIYVTRLDISIISYFFTINITTQNLCFCKNNDALFRIRLKWNTNCSNIFTVHGAS